MRSNRGTWPPDPAFVSQAAEGDEKALSEILRLAHPKLIGFYRVAGADDPEDLAADVLVSVITHLPRLRKAAAFEGWFWAIARARFRTWLRKRRRPERHAPPGPAPIQPPEAAETAAEHERIRAALETLSADERALLWLREVEGLDYAQIGGRLGAATGTVRVAAHRARRKLRNAYGES